jgi:hypothetical protein
MKAPMSLSNSYLFLLPAGISIKTLINPASGWAGMRDKSTMRLQITFEDNPEELPEGLEGDRNHNPTVLATLSHHDNPIG